jgi:hypothetical protein
MARARRSAKAQAEQATGYICPECGRSFTRAASLGAHRHQAHGVAGAARAQRVSKEAPVVSAARTQRVVSPTPAAPPTRGGGVSSRTNKRSAAANGNVDTDALLARLFPSGIPARQDVIRRVNAWLDEAERLAKLR